MQLRPIVCALLVLYLSACTGWHTVERQGLTQLINTDHPTTVRVTMRDSSVIVLEQPKMAFGDSLSGLVNGARSNVAVADVTQVQIRRVNERRTTAIFFAVAVAGIAAMVALNEGSDSGN
jgi:type IV pilus biogenesis protein CpaD/CtpE